MKNNLVIKIIIEDKSMNTINTGNESMILRFGKHKGDHITTIPLQYLGWLFLNKDNLRERVTISDNILNYITTAITEINTIDGKHLVSPLVKFGKYIAHHYSIVPNHYKLWCINNIMDSLKDIDNDFYLHLKTNKDDIERIERNVALASHIDDDYDPSLTLIDKKNLSIESKEECVFYDHRQMPEYRMTLDQHSWDEEGRKVEPEGIDGWKVIDTSTEEEIDYENGLGISDDQWDQTEREEMYYMNKQSEDIDRSEWDDIGNYC